MKTSTRRFDAGLTRSCFVDSEAPRQIASYVPMLSYSGKSEARHALWNGGVLRTSKSVRAQATNYMAEDELASGVKPRRIVFSVTTRGSMKWSRYSGPPAFVPSPDMRKPPKGCRSTRAPVICRFR